VKEEIKFASGEHRSLLTMFHFATAKLLGIISSCYLSNVKQGQIDARERQVERIFI